MVRGRKDDHLALRFAGFFCRSAEPEPPGLDGVSLLLALLGLRPGFGPCPETGGPGTSGIAGGGGPGSDTGAGIGGDSTDDGSTGVYGGGGSLVGGAEGG